MCGSLLNQLVRLAHTLQNRFSRSSGANEQTIKAIAGHVSQRMLDRYSHIRLEAKRNAIEALSRPKVEPIRTSTVDQNEATLN